MISDSALLAVNLAMIGGVMALLWLASLPLKNSSIVDIFWGAGFVLIAWVTYLLIDGPLPRKLLLTAAVTLWGIRLTAYLAWRNSGKGEDFRYRAMREKWGRAFPAVSLLTVFALQGAIMWFVALPVQLGQRAAEPLGPLDGLGFLVWAVGYFFESVGDWQMARFKAEPAHRGHVMDQGLWRYTRHPNYFGDFMVWWGIFLIARAGGSPWWSVVSPVVMSILLLWVSGVTLLESSLAQRTEGYRDYVARTSSFFPWPPRKR